MWNDLKGLAGTVARGLHQRRSSLPVLGVGVFAALLLQTYTSSLSFGGSIYLAGFLQWVIRLVAMSYLAGLLLDFLQMGRLHWRDLLRIQSQFIVGLSQTYFLVYLLETVLLSTRLSGFFMPFWGDISLFMLLEALLWPLYELTFVSDRWGVAAFSGLFSFWKANGIPWGLLTLVGVVGQVLLQYSLFFGGLWGHLLLRSLARTLFLALRILLYHTLTTTSRRSRDFQRRARG